MIVFEVCFGLWFLEDDRICFDYFVFFHTLTNMSNDRYFGILNGYMFHNY